MIWKAAALILFFYAPALYAGNVEVSNISYQEIKAGFFTVSGTLTNAADVPREVVIRAQVAIYDRGAPKGDLPVAVVRKDTTVILRAGESRNAQVYLINDGRMPKGSFRVEPMFRIRREREWNY